MGSTAAQSPWRDRDLVLVLVGGTVNNLGDWMLMVALPVFVYVETGSGLATAAVFLVELVIGVGLGPIGGSLVDRWDLRATLVVTNALQAVALLPLLAVTSSRLWPAFVVTALQSLIQQVNDPASFALVPRIVSDEQLVQVNAAREGIGDRRGSTDGRCHVAPADESNPSVMPLVAAWDVSRTSGPTRWLTAGRCRRVG